MVTLGPGFSAFTLLSTTQQLQFAVQLLDLPKHVTSDFRKVRRELAWMIGNDPFIVAVPGNYLA